MCLAILSYKRDSEIPIILIGNRDEYHSRPTANCHYWEDYPNILGGRDLKSGGSWLAINTNGLFAAVTNYRDPQLKAPSAPLSRGKIVMDFVLSKDPEGFLYSLKENCSKYPGFNLIAGWGTNLYYFSNISKDLTPLHDGVYGLSNHLLDSPWPKVVKVKQKLRDLIDTKGNAFEAADSFEFMTNSSRFPDADLPDTGVGIELERFLSPIFIVGERYGTRCTSVLKIAKTGNVDFYEQNYTPSGMKSEYSHYSFQIR